MSRSTGANDDGVPRLDVLLICRDARADSLVANLLLAMEAKRAAKDVGVMLSGEALLALRIGSFSWPRGFWPQAVRWSVADRAAEVGLPVRGKGQFRALDAMALLQSARHEGVRLFACPIWAPLLKTDVPWPEWITPASAADALGLLDRASTVVGSL
jgi:hypothetical protein